MAKPEPSAADKDRARDAQNNRMDAPENERHERRDAPVGSGDVSPARLGSELAAEKRPKARTP